MLFALFVIIPRMYLQLEKRRGSNRNCFWKNPPTSKRTGYRSLPKCHSMNSWFTDSFVSLMFIDTVLTFLLFSWNISSGYIHNMMHCRKKKNAYFLISFFRTDISRIVLLWDILWEKSSEAMDFCSWFGIRPGSQLPLGHGKRRGGGNGRGGGSWNLRQKIFNVPT